MIRTRFSFIPITIFLVFFLLGCKNNSVNDQINLKILPKPREVHNTNPKWGGDPKVALEFVRDIGEMDPKSEEFLYWKARDIALDSLGNIYILDGGNYRIKKLDKNGNYIEAIGRQGQGPGEFTSPIAIDIAKDGNLYVAEYGKRCVYKIPPDRRNIKTIRLNNSDNIHKMRLTKNNDIAIFTPSMETPIPLGWGESKPLIQIYDQDGKLLRDMVEPKKYKDVYTTHFGNKISFSISKEDMFYVTFSNQNRIEKYSYNGELLLKIDRKLNYDVVPEIRENPQVFKQTASVVSTAIDIDTMGRIWVCTYTRQPRTNGTGSLSNFHKYVDELDVSTDMQEIEIFDNDGNLLGKIPLSINVSIMRIFGERIFFIGRQGLIIHEYKIIEK